MTKDVKLDRFGRPLRDTTHPSDPKSMTIKSHAKGLTVNEIMARFAHTGTIPNRVAPGEFLDSTQLPGLFDALNMQTRIKNYFNGLDAVTRAKFRNDPLQMVKFISDPKNVNQGLEMGLLKLTPQGEKAKAAHEKAQARKKEEARAAFVADISQIVKEKTPPPGGV